MPRPRILIAGDAPPSDPLKDDYDLSFASDADRVVQLATGEPAVDLVLLDAKLGSDVCRRLKADERSAAIPVIVVSGRNESKEQERSFAAGAADYVAKPITPALLLARIGMQIELLQARDLIDSLALIDPLTGIPNRRRFRAALEQEWRRSQRNRSPLSVVMLDIDDFEKYNGLYGRAAGDDLLRTMAQSVAGVARRAGDLAARVDGGSFALVLPESNGDAGRALLRNLQNAIRLLAVPHKRSSCSDRVTISASGVSLVASVVHNVDFAIESAESLLAHSKKSGRNQSWHLDAATGARERVHA